MCVTVEVRRDISGVMQAEVRTGLSVLVCVSNTSVRPNTVIAMEVKAPVPLETPPEDANFVTDVRVRPHRLFDRSMTEEELRYWELPDD